MFGGVGLYSGELFFGLIDDDTLFFKTDGSNSAEYIARNMPRFMPFPDRPEAVMAYHQVPADIIEDDEDAQWLGAQVGGGGAGIAGRKSARPRRPRAKSRREGREENRRRARRAKRRKKALTRVLERATARCG